MIDFDIMKEFYDKTSGMDFSVRGIIDCNDNIHTLGTDSKIIGRIFEMHVQPILEAIAKEHDLVLKTPESQNVYPDFILMKDENSKEKIAIDVKTTYRKSDRGCIKFTLGSYGSYLRDNKKNIEYKYTDYAKHYVIGFVYKRNGSAQDSKRISLENRDTIVCPFKDVKCFIQEKYKISGDKPGSGNTENIGSISTKKFDDFVDGNGPFTKLGKELFDIYWKYHKEYRENKESGYDSLDNNFVNWFGAHKDEIQLPYPCDLDELTERIEEMAKNLEQ